MKLETTRLKKYVTWIKRFIILRATALIFPFPNIEGQLRCIL